MTFFIITTRTAVGSVADTPLLQHLRERQAEKQQRTYRKKKDKSATQAPKTERAEKRRNRKQKVRRVHERLCTWEFTLLHQQKGATTWTPAKKKVRFLRAESSREGFISYHCRQTMVLHQVLPEAK